MSHFFSFIGIFYQFLLSSRFYIFVFSCSFILCHFFYYASWHGINLYFWSFSSISSLSKLSSCSSPNFRLLIFSVFVIVWKMDAIAQIQIDWTFGFCLSIWPQYYLEEYFVNRNVCLSKKLILAWLSVRISESGFPNPVLITVGLKTRLCPDSGAIMKMNSVLQFFLNVSIKNCTSLFTSVYKVKSYKITHSFCQKAFYSVASKGKHQNASCNCTKDF